MMAEINRTTITCASDNAGVPVPKSFLLATMIFGFLIGTVSLLAITILLRCKKIMDQIRITAIHLCAANFGYGLTMIANGAYHHIKGMPCGSIFKLIPFFCLLYFMFLSFTGIDRLLSLTLTMKYTFWSRKRNMYIVAASLYFFAACFGVLPNIPYKYGLQCQGIASEMFTYSGLVSFVATMSFSISTHFFSYIYIGFIVVKNTLPGPFTEDNAYTDYWTIAKKVTKLGITSIIFVSPYLISRVQDILNFQEKETVSNVSVATYISISLIHLHQIVSPIFIMCSYHECRFVAMYSVLCCCHEMKEKMQQRYREYYSTYTISVPQRREQSEENDIAVIQSRDAIRLESLENIEYLV